MGPIDALEIALRREAESIDMYRKFSLKFPEAARILEFLMNEEEKHKKLIEKEIARLTRY